MACFVKVVNGPEIQEILHQSPTVRSFLDSLMKLDYAAFFKALSESSQVARGLVSPDAI